MANDLCMTVSECRLYAAEGTRPYHEMRLRFFPPSGLLEFIVTNIICPLPKTSSCNLYVLVHTDWLTKLTRAIPGTYVTSTFAKYVFVDHWVILYGTQTHLLTDIGPEFVSKFLGAVCGYLRVQHLTTTPYHPYINSQVERFNKTIVDQLQHCRKIRPIGIS